MGILETLGEIFFGEKPKGPVYTESDLFNANERYKLAFCQAMEALSHMEYNAPYNILDKRDGYAEGFKLNKAYGWFEVVKSWTDREFIPKVCGAAFARRVGEYKRELTKDFSTRDPMVVARGCLADARASAKDLDDALHFFIADRRSNFDTRRNAPDGYGPLDTARWFSGGHRDIVDAARRADEIMSAYIEFASR